MCCSDDRLLLLALLLHSSSVDVLLTFAQGHSAPGCASPSNAHQVRVSGRHGAGLLLSRLCSGCFDVVLLDCSPARMDTVPELGSSSSMGMLLATCTAWMANWATRAAWSL